MKNYLILLLTLCVLSCSSDDSTEGMDTALSGVWTLTNVSCFCGFPDPLGFEQTELRFNTENNEILVSQNGNGLEYFRPAGRYSYQEVGETIVLDDGRAYRFTLDGNVLTLNFVDEPLIADDEISYSLRRN